jgi:hypothetical protein
MKWRVRKPGAQERAIRRWHRWFAWKPVRVPTMGPMSGMTMVWLDTIERRVLYMDSVYELCVYRKRSSTDERVFRGRRGN